MHSGDGSEWVAAVRLLHRGIFGIDAAWHCFPRSACPDRWLMRCWPFRSLERQDRRPTMRRREEFSWAGRSSCFTQEVAKVSDSFE